LLVGGLDPSGGRGRWGYALLECRGLRCRVAESGEVPASRSWAAVARASRPLYVGVDAPLTVGGGAWRECDRLASSMGARLLPLTLPGMARLARVGVSLAALLREAGRVAVETHPLSLWESMGLPRHPPWGMGPHEWDAVAAALAALAVAIGRPLAAAAWDCVLVIGAEGLRARLGPPGEIELVEAQPQRYL
jgi:predicted nuclease with RNAse H fold